jgi:hypothetical protein
MASVTMGATAVHYEPTDAQGVRWQGAIRYGITDHLEWADLLGLRYAFLDDRPADGRAPMPLSLALRAGLRGFGWSSLDGMIVQPIVSLDVLKHVADRWALSLGADWVAQWVEHPSGIFPYTPGYSGSLAYWSRDWSTIALRAEVMRQLTPRFALGVVPTVAQSTDCVDPTCDWKSRSGSVALMAGVRPLSWLTVRLAPAAGVRNRPNLPLPTTYPDGTPIMIPPLTVTWVSVTGWLDFYW